MIDSDIMKVSVWSERRASRGLMSYLRSLKVGQKLVMIYVLGIFLPLLITNGIVLRGVLAEAGEHEHEFMLSTIDSIMDGIVRELEPIEDVSEFIYTDRTIYRILAGKFDAFSQFVTVYTDYLQPAVNKYISVFPGVARMIIYTENKMVDISGSYMGINDYVRSTAWYEYLKRPDLRMFTLVHLDMDPRMEVEPRRYVSLFRELDSPALARAGELILRIDINSKIFYRHLESMPYEGSIELIDPWGNKVAEYDSGSDEDPFFSFRVPFADFQALDGWILRGGFTGSITNESWSARWTRLLVISGLSLAFTSLFVLLLSRSITSRLARLSNQMKKVKHEDFSPIEAPVVVQDEVGQLMTDFNIMAEKIDELINDGYKLEIERGRLLLARRQAELNALQSQVNPHFLYNVLESVRMKSHIKGEHETAKIIKRISRMFRRMTGWNEDLVTLDDELSFTREYLEIQEYRFGEKLSSEFNIRKDISNLKIPKLSIQALVENACAHGLESKAEGGTVSVAVDSNLDFFEITVADDGIGCDPESVRRLLKLEGATSKHTGLANTYRRLKLHFGENVDFQFNSEIGKGTSIRIRIGISNGNGTDNNS